MLMTQLLLITIWPLLPTLILKWLHCSKCMSLLGDIHFLLGTHHQEQHRRLDVFYSRKIFSRLFQTLQRGTL